MKCPDSPINGVVLASVIAGAVGGVVAQRVRLHPETLASHIKITFLVPVLHLSQLPINAPGEAEEDDLTAWAPVPMWETGSSRLLAASQPRPSCSCHLGWQWMEDSLSFSFSLSLSLCLANQ